MLRREFDKTGRRGPVGGRERVLCLPVAMAVHGRALACMRPRGEPGGAGRRGTALSRRSCPLSAATGGPDAAEDSGEGGPSCHRRQEEAK